jgi:carbon starvation protein
MKTGVRPVFVLIPMFFMFLVTLSSLFFVAVRNFNQGVYLLSIISALLFILAVVLLVLARSSLKKELAIEHLEAVA